MGGDIQVESRPGAGSTFRVRLMMTEVNEPTIAPASLRIVGYEGDPRTVLVVDDDENHRMLVRDILAPLGFVVMEATDAVSCLTLMEAVSPDLFLLDVSMPGMTGWDLAEALRARGEAGAIIMLSANVGESVPALGSESAHDATLPKPFALRQLLDRIRDVLQITWIEESDISNAVADEPAPGPAAEIPPGAVQELMRLGRIGYVKGIEAKLAELEAEAADPAFVRALKAHLDRFDLKGYLNRLEAHADDR